MTLSKLAQVISADAERRNAMDSSFVPLVRVLGLLDGIRLIQRPSDTDWLQVGSTLR